MNIAYGRLALIAIGAFIASAAPEFDAAWKSAHIPETATFGRVMHALMLACIEGLRAGIPAMTTAIIAFFMRQDSSLPMFTTNLPEIKKVSEAMRETDG